jgi:hypothetical protein
VITGTGRWRYQGDAMKIKKFCRKPPNLFVYTQIDVLDYNKRIDGKVLDCSDFYKTQRIILVILTDLQKYQIL